MNKPISLTSRVLVTMTCSTLKNQLDIQISSLNHFNFLVLSANICGALINILYFYFFVFSKNESITWSIVIPVIVTLILCAAGVILHRLWARGLALLARKYRPGLTVSDDILSRARREILNLPVSSCIISLLTWGLAAIIMSGIRYWIYNDGNSIQTAWHEAFRVWFGITVAGVVTSAIVLFAMEIHCRKIRPLFFPHGGLRDTPGVIFLNLRQRTLITFGLTGILPMILIGTLCYYQIKSTQNYPPEQLLQNLFYLI